MKTQVTPEKIQEWIKRQEQLPHPNPNYLTWLRKQFTLVCQAQVIKKDLK